MRFGFLGAVATLALVGSVSWTAELSAQETWEITPGSATVRGRLLEPGVDTFAVVVSSDGQEQSRTLLVDRLQEIRVDGRPALLRVQTIYQADGAVAITDSVSADRATLAPIRHRSHSAARVMALDFHGARVTGAVDYPEKEDVRIALDAPGPLFDSNAVDLILRTLPLTDGDRFRIPVYLREKGGAVDVQVRVAGTETVAVGDTRVDAWVVETEWAGSRMTFWIDGDARELVRIRSWPRPGVTVRIERTHAAGPHPSSTDAAAGDGARSGEASLFAFFTGEWSCAGEFANGKPIEADLSFRPVLGGKWLEYRHDDRPPGAFHALAHWGRARGPDRLVSVMHDNYRGARLFVSDGWSDGGVTFTKQALLGDPGVPERFIYRAESADTFRMTWEVDRDGEGWSMGDYLVCRRIESA